MTFAYWQGCTKSRTLRSASYGTLRQFAETLGLTQAVMLLEATLTEEKAADQKLTEVAVSTINIQASEEVEAE